MENLGLQIKELTENELRTLQDSIINTLKARKNTRTGAVVHHIHVNTPHKHIVKLFVTHVPESITAGKLQSIINNAGYIFQEFDTAWANHYIQIGLKGYDALQSQFSYGKAETITYDELVLKAAISEAVN